MTTGQISRVWFRGRKWGCYKRLEALRERGYLTTLVYMEDGRPRGWCYYITEKAAAELGIDRPDRVARLLDPNRQNYRVALAEIFVRLHRTGWAWKSAVAARRAYGMNPNAEINGVLRSPQGLHYAVYLIGANPREAKLRVVRAEIRANQQLAKPLNSAVVLFQSREAMKRFGSDPLGAYRLARLPHPDGLDVLARLADPAALLTAPGLDPAGWQAAPPDEPWADWLLRSSRGEAYLVELLTNDAAKLRGLLSYTPELARARGRPVLALAFEDELAAWRGELGRLAHVRLVPVPRAWLAPNSRENSVQGPQSGPRG